MKLFPKSLALATVVLAAGCSSAPLTIQTPPVQPDEEVLGEASGGCTGIMLFQLIPIRQNARFEAAYVNALRSRGATRLINPTIRERWFWAWVLNGYSFRVSGTAVRKR